MPGDDRRFVGLNSLDPGEHFTDYHLHRLFVKRALGWSGPLPAVLFDNSADNTAMSSAVATSLLSTAPGADGVYLLLCAPESPDYAQVLRSEMDAIHSVFGLERVSITDATALYKLTPR